MSDIFSIALPVIGLAGLGYLAAITGLLSREAGDGLASFVFNLAIPVLLFRSLATAEYSAGSPWYFWLTYGAAILVAWVGAIVLIALIVRRGYRASIIAGVAAGFSNLVLVGIPLVERAYGQDGLNIHFVLLAVHLPFMMAVSTFLMEFAARADGAEDAPLSVVGVAGELLKSFAVNPIIIGILAGAGWYFTGLGLAQAPTQIMDLIGRTAGPLALFSLGMSFVKYGIRGNWQPGIGLAFLSVVVMPAVALFVGTHILALPPLWLKVAVLGAACPTGVNAYLFATYFKVAEGLASSTIVLAALMSIITIPFWLSVLAAY